MFFEPSGVSAPLRHFENDPREMRLAAEFRKLIASARNYMFSNNRLIPLGDDPVVRHLLSSSGFGDLDVHVHRTCAGERMVTALCIPTRIWRDKDSRYRLFELKRQAGEMNTSCILVPQRWLRASVRSSVARVLASARNVRYTRSHMGLVLGHLDSIRISSLAETASAIPDHDDPIGAVLAMACHGLLTIDRTKPIAPGTYTAAKSTVPGQKIAGGKR